MTSSPPSPHALLAAHYHSITSLPQTTSHHHFIISSCSSAHHHRIDSSLRHFVTSSRSSVDHHFIAAHIIITSSRLSAHHLFISPHRIIPSPEHASTRLTTLSPQQLIARLSDHQRTTCTLTLQNRGAFRRRIITSSLHHSITQTSHTSSQLTIRKRKAICPNIRLEEIEQFIDLARRLSERAKHDRGGEGVGRAGEGGGRKPRVHGLVCAVWVAALV